MKRLIDFFRGKQAPSAPPPPSAPGLRNVPGGMAWICGQVGEEATLNGRAVKTVRFADGVWQIKPEQFVVFRRHMMDGHGRVCRAGLAAVVGIPDDCLEPWKDTGLTDEEVRDLYAPKHLQFVDAPSRPKERA